jgi:hypothetical protein
VLDSLAHQPTSDEMDIAQALLEVYERNSTSIDTAPKSQTPSDAGHISRASEQHLLLRYERHDQRQPIGPIAALDIDGDAQVDASDLLMLLGN